MAEVLRETFRSPFGRDTMEGAIQVLDQIRKNKPESSGWREVRAYVDKDFSDGKYYAVRVCEKI